MTFAGRYEIMKEGGKCGDYQKKLNKLYLSFKKEREVLK